MNKLPLTMYMNMSVFEDEDYEEKEEEIELCIDELNYRTLEIFAHKVKKTDNEKYMLDHYKISFRDYYRLSGIDGTIKNIEIEPFWIFESNFDSTSIKYSSQNIANYICDKKNIKINEYDFFYVECSEPQKENIVSKSDKFLREQYENTSLTFVKRVDYRCIEYICKDLDSEELDAIIYPKEYTHFKYENN